VLGRPTICRLMTVVTLLATYAGTLPALTADRPNAGAAHRGQPEELAGVDAADPCPWWLDPSSKRPEGVEFGSPVGFRLTPGCGLLPADGRAAWLAGEALSCGSARRASSLIALHCLLTV